MGFSAGDYNDEGIGELEPISLHLAAFIKLQFIQLIARFKN